MHPALLTELLYVVRKSGSHLHSVLLFASCWHHQYQNDEVHRDEAVEEYKSCLLHTAHFCLIHQGEPVVEDASIQFLSCNFQSQVELSIRF